MGLLDQVLGGMLGQQGSGRPSGGMLGGGQQGMPTSGQTSGQMSGMSPIMMALMALLSSGAMGRGGAGGGLGGLVGDLSGQNDENRATGSAGGGQGGLGSLLDRLKQNGHGDVAHSWVGPGENRHLSPEQLGEALGGRQVDDLSRQTGMARPDLLSELSRILPGAVDRLTPHGRLPNDDELSRW